MHRLLVLGAVAWLAGCAGVTLAPYAMDRAVRVEQMGMTFTPKGSGQLSLRLEVSNPTLWDCLATGVDFELQVEGRSYAAGTQRVELPLPAGQRRTLELAFPLLAVPAAPQASERPLRVEVNGKVAVLFDDLERRLPFRHEQVLRVAYFRPAPGP